MIFLCVLFFPLFFAVPIEKKSISTKENTKEGTILIDIVKEFDLFNLKNEEESKRIGLCFKIIYDYWLNNDYFSIGNQDGVVKVKKKIDRETACWGKVPCQRELRVFMFRPKEKMTLYEFLVEIEDEDDNPLYFPFEGIFGKNCEKTENCVEYKIHKEEKVGFLIFLPRAFDKDKTKIEYKLENLDEKTFEFSLASEYYPAIKLLVPLKKDFYKFKLQASTKGPALKSISVEVQISVVSSPSNPLTPVFEKSSYEVKTPEFSLSSPLTVKLETGGDSTFKLPLDPDIKDFIKLDSKSGGISLKKKMLFYKIPFIKFSIVAQTNDQFQKTGLAWIKIELTVEFTSAQIFFTSSVKKESHEFYGGSPKGSALGYFYIFDDALGNLGEMDGFLLEGTSDFFYLEKVKEREFVLINKYSIKKKPNTKEYLKFSAFIKNKENENTIFSKDFKRIFTDDSPPYFPKPPMEVTMVENTGLNKIFEVGLATDDDTQINAPISYSLCPHDPNITKFASVDSSTAHVTLINNLDHESYKVMNICVMAENFCDICTPEQTYFNNSNYKGYYFIIITIQDVNDNAPFFPQSPYILSVPENSPIGTLVGQIKPVDRDSPPFNKMEITFTKPDPVPFTMDKEGTVHTKKIFDREITEKVEFKVTATDINNSSLKTTSVVIVYIEDVNEFPHTIDTNCHGKKIELKRFKYMESVNNKLCYLFVKDKDPDPKVIFLIEPQSPLFYQEKKSLVFNISEMMDFKEKNLKKTIFPFNLNIKAVENEFKDITNFSFTLVIKESLIPISSSRLNIPNLLFIYFLNFFYFLV